MYSGMKINERRRREYHLKGYWGEKTLADYWTESVRRTPGKLAVADSRGGRLTYAEADAASDRVAAWLQSVGVRPGEFVSTQIPGWTEFTVCCIGCLKAGTVINPIPPSLRERELDHILNTCESRVLFVPAFFHKFDYLHLGRTLPATVPSLRHVVAVEKGETPDRPDEHITPFSQILCADLPPAEPVRADADDLAVVLFTSGTESYPKGVMLTHNTVYAAIRPFADVLGLTADDVMLMPAPVAHATGFHHGVVTPFLLGGTSVLLDRFSPDKALSLIERERCTYTMGAAPIIHDMFCQMGQQRYDLASLRFFLCGGAPAPWHIFEGALASGFKILSVYGSTESVPHAVSSPDAPVERLLGTDGRAVPHVDVRVVDADRNPVPPGVEGEEASRGPNVFVGYLGEPELTAQALDDEGWYYSGDLCRMDAEGYLRITGRKKDIIIRGGENISSVEVESILLRHPLIRDAAVVSMPDPRLGERSCAYVMLYDPAATLTLDDLRAFFAERNVAKYKDPERLEIVSSIPRNPSGKIRKFLLRKDIREKMAREGLLAPLADSCASIVVSGLPKE